MAVAKASAGRATKHAKAVKEIVARYLANKDFEGCRSSLHALPFEAMKDVLALATQPKAKAKDLLVMVLADSGYPPAFPAMRTWMDDPDVDEIALPAATALDRAAGKTFGVERLWSGGRGSLPETFAAVRAAWDAGDIIPEPESVWLARKQADRERDERVPPPPCPRMTPAENASLTRDLIALKNELADLPLDVQFKLGVAAIARARAIYAAYDPEDAVVGPAIDALEQRVSGASVTTGKHQEPVREAVRRANEVARWSKRHGRWRDPSAKAAAEVAQGVLYALDPTVNARLQPLHKAREAMEFSGVGYSGVRAELDWQLAEVRRAAAEK
ncbi:MAG: hypothetical protein U0414_40885 [Polyangiaceae bacterium]